MAKKARRAKKVKSKNVKKSVDAVVEKMPASPTITPTPKPAQRKTKFRAGGRRRTPTEAEMREEYAYVLKDLRLVFILAGAMFALLIILNIVLG